MTPTDQFKAVQERAVNDILEHCEIATEHPSELPSDKQVNHALVAIAKAIMLLAASVIAAGCMPAIPGMNPAAVLTRPPYRYYEQVIQVNTCHIKPTGDFDFDVTRLGGMPARAEIKTMREIHITGTYPFAEPGCEGKTVLKLDAGNTAVLAIGSVCGGASCLYTSRGIWR